MNHWAVKYFETSSEKTTFSYLYKLQDNILIQVFISLAHIFGQILRIESISSQNLVVHNEN